MSSTSLKSLLDPSLSEPVVADSGLSIKEVQELFLYFKEHPLFNWKNSLNDCEDRANAICILLDAWKIPNYKAWVFSGNFVNRPEGNLVNFWQFHVAALLKVSGEEEPQYLVLDPATLPSAGSIETWADGVTENFGSVHFITAGDYYIFRPGEMHHSNWHKRNWQNYKWTIQGLAGINGVSPKGKAQLVFCKEKIRETEKKFRELIRNKSGIHTVI
jgi:hypothetical protein